MTSMKTQALKKTLVLNLTPDKVEIVNTPIGELKSSHRHYFDLILIDQVQCVDSHQLWNRSLELVKDSILTSEEVNEIQISKTLFCKTVEPGGYTDVEKFDTSYSADTGCTKLYDSIIDSERRISQYRDDP